MSKTHRPSRLRLTRRGAGFSLLELVIVLAIIGILSGIAVPRYVNALNRYRVRALAQRIVADLNMIASESRAVSASRWVWFIPDQWYMAFDLPDPDAGTSYYLVQTTLEPYKANIAKADFEGYTHLTFDGYGKPNRGGSIVVTAGEATRTIVLDKATGKASVQ